jgi:hypothetical protein
VLALGAGGYLVSTRLGGAAAPVPEPVAVATAAALPAQPSAEPAPPPTALATAAPQTTIASVTGAASEVRLKVETDPPGATLEKGGFQICPETPCEISVARNEGIELTAKKGALRAQVKLLPQNDQSVSMKLATAAARPKPTASAASAAQPMCEIMYEGLKILRPCQQK